MQRIAAAVVMVPRIGRRADLASNSFLLKALKAGALGGRATCRDNDDEVQPLRLLVPLSLHSPLGRKRRAALILIILKRN